MITLPSKRCPIRSSSKPKTTITNDHQICLLLFGDAFSSCGFMNAEANTGLIKYATTSDAERERIKVTGNACINEPITPGQNSNGKNGASVVNVPARTGANTSPAAFLAASFI